MSDRLIRALLLVASAAIMVGLITWGVHAYNESLREDGRAEIRLQVETQRKADQAREDAKAAAIAKSHKEALDAFSVDRDRAAADAAGARDAAVRLQQRVAQLERDARRQAGCSAAPAEGGAPAADPIGVLADLQRRADERAGILADYADRARAAGALCERLYDSLTAPGAAVEGSPSP